MALKKLKGKQVKVLLNDEELAASTNCSLSLSTNSTDVATKDDEDSEFENSEFVNYSWEISNEAFVASVTDLKTLLSAWLDGSLVKVDVEKDGAYMLMGAAYITSISVSAPKDGYATVNLSLTGDGVLA